MSSTAFRHDPSSGRQYHIETIGNALAAVDRCRCRDCAIEGVCVGGGLEIASLVTSGWPPTRHASASRSAASASHWRAGAGAVAAPGRPAVAAEMLLESRFCRPMKPRCAVSQAAWCRLHPVRYRAAALDLAHRRRLAAGGAAEQSQYSPLSIAWARLQQHELEKASPSSIRTIITKACARFSPSVRRASPASKLRR